MCFWITMLLYSSLSKFFKKRLAVNMEPPAKGLIVHISTQKACPDSINLWEVWVEWEV